MTDINILAGILDPDGFAGGKMKLDGSASLNSELGTVEGCTVRCAYHGWTFRLDGTLQSVPREEDYAGTGFDRADCRMQPLPRLARYHRS